MDAGDILMPFGKYAGTPLRRVPAEYLHWLSGRSGLKHSHREVYIFACRRSVSYLKSCIEDAQISPRINRGVPIRLQSVAEFLGATQ